MPAIRWRVVAPALGLVAASVLALSACGGSAKSAATTASKAATANSAKFLVNARKVRPPQYGGPTTPAKAPKGIKLGVISCSQTLQGCVTLAAAAAKAASSIGWKERTFDGQSNTTTQNAQIENAVSWGAKVIVLIAIDPRTVQTGLKTAKKAGAVIVSADNSGSSPNSPVKIPAGAVWPSVDVSADYYTLAKTEAQWIIADSKGKANVLVYGDKEYPAIDEGIRGLLAGFKSCQTCTISPVQYFTATQIATSVGPNVVSYLRNHPDVDYVYAPFDPSAPTMVTSIKNAGMANRVKLLSYLGDQQNLQFIINGDVQVADGAVDNTYNGYAVVDQAIRILNHQPLIKPNNEQVPIQVLDKTNVGDSAQKKTGWVAPYDYESRFVHLWK